MAHYEQRLERDLAIIKEKVADLAAGVQTNFRDASRALFTGDQKLAYSVIMADHPINRASRELDKICHRFFAVHLPTAGHLRFASAVMRVNIELERIGDYAVTVCREAVQIGHPPEGDIGQHLGRLADEAMAILGQAFAAFSGGDTDQARRDIEKAREVTRGFNEVFKTLVNEEGKIHVEDLLYYLVIFNKLGRVVAQAKNICEETVFAFEGRTKAPKVYRVLFLDEDNSVLGPMAQTIARKNFAQWGEYDSAGRQAADAINGNLGRFLAERGLELAYRSPRALDPAADLADYHVIVSLQGPVKSYIDAVPFQTVALEWEIGGPPADSDSADTIAQLEAIYRALALEVRDLMVTLHGEEE